jgi:biopolymer transport protein ExbB
MHDSFILKTIFWIVVLVAVLAIIGAVIYSGRGGDAVAGGRTQTLLEEFFISGGVIVWFILLPMSLIMVYLAVEYSLTIRRKKLLPSGIGREIIEIIRQSGLGQLKSQVAERSDLVSIAVAEAVAKSKGDWFRMRSILAESLQEQALRLLRKIEWVSLIGNVSPMVGLFGTVVGMIELFNAIVKAGGQPQPAHLAHGISVALVTTFWGLLIAIPALTVHGIFRNRIETLVNDSVEEAESVMPEIRRFLEKQVRQTQDTKTAYSV